MSAPLLCPKAYRRDGARKPIICRKNGLPCAHQYWCDMAVEYKHRAGAASCPGQEDEDGKSHQTDAE